MVRRIWFSAIVLGVPRVALACPVCFGQNDSPMAHAMNAGIFFMLGVVAVILTGFGSFVFYLSRRASLVDVPDFPARHAQHDAGPYVQSHPQEGTARC
jgi:hypothetical protein